MKKELRALVRQVEAAGYTTRLTKKQHLLVLLDNLVVTSFAGTPSDYRSWRNSFAQLRRSGFSI